MKNFKRKNIGNFTFSAIRCSHNFNITIEEDFGEVKVIDFDEINSFFYILSFLKKYPLNEHQSHSTIEAMSEPMFANGNRDIRFLVNFNGRIEKIVLGEFIAGNYFGDFAISFRGIYLPGKDIPEICDFVSGLVEEK